MEKLKKNILRFLVVGGTTTAIDFVIYMVISQKLDVTISKIISMLLASFFSYAFNKNWTFEKRDHHHIRYLWKYYIAFAVNVTVNTTINRIVYNAFGMKVVAFVAATGCAMVVNFLLQRLWVFRGEKR